LRKQLRSCLLKRKDFHKDETAVNNPQSALERCQLLHQGAYPLRGDEGRWFPIPIDKKFKTSYNGYTKGTTGRRLALMRVRK
jgi:hypothetical protein